jgi:hypothetical protein
VESEEKAQSLLSKIEQRDLLALRKTAEMRADDLQCTLRSKLAQACGRREGDMGTADKSMHAKYTTFIDVVARESRRFGDGLSNDVQLLRVSDDTWSGEACVAEVGLAHRITPRIF